MRITVLPQDNSRNSPLVFFNIDVLAAFIGFDSLVGITWQHKDTLFAVTGEARACMKMKRTVTNGLGGCFIIDGKSRTFCKFLAEMPVTVS